MDIKNIDFHDSVLLNIRISYSEIALSIRLDDGNATEISLCCYDVLGLDNLILGDDTIISRLKITDADKNDKFMRQAYNAYGQDLEYGGKASNPIKDLQITLTNNITFHVYCQSIYVSDTLNKRSVVDKLLATIHGSKLDDFWYDVTMEELDKTLSQFTTNDWKTLFDKIPLQDKTDNECLLDFLEGMKNKFAKKCVKKLKSLPNNN